MASKYARTVGGNWSTDATWSTTSGGAADTTKPTAADDVFLDANSGNVTVDASAVCRSVNCTGYTGTFGGSSSVPLAIGDGTAGAGNVALKLVAGQGFTWTSATITISFVSTSATQQTIETAGKTLPNITFNGAGSSYLLSDSLTLFANCIITHSAGTLNTGSQSISATRLVSTTGSTRVLTLGSSAISLVGTSTTALSYNNASNLTVSANTSVITMSGAGSAMESAGINWNGLSIVQSGSGTAGTSGTAGAFTVANFTRTGTAAKTDSMNIVSSFTCTNAFTVNSNSDVNRVLVQSSTVGTARTITAASVVISNIVDFQDITGAGAATWTVAGTGATAIGDCGGNSGITASTSVQQTWSGTSGGSWSANAWTTRVPLPQDDVVVNAAFSGSQTVTMDMPRVGRSVDFTGISGSNLTVNWSTACSIYGSLTLSSAITNFTNSTAMTFAGRGNYTITSAGKGFGSTTTIAAPGGTYTLQDALGQQSNFALVFQAGSFDSNNFNFGSPVDISTSGSLTKSVTLGTSTVTLSRANAAVTLWNFATTTGLTFSGASSTIQITGSNNQTAVFAGGGLTYGTLTNTVSTSTGQFSITGANSFSAINFSRSGGTRTLAFTAATTTTIRDTNGFNVFGTSGNNITVSSVTAATHTLSSTLQQAGNIDYLTVTNSIATGGGSWYAGANSTDGTGNTGWIFTAAPSFVTAGMSMNALEYQFLAYQNNLFQGSINNQRIVFYNSKSGASEVSEPSAELAFLKFKTGLTHNSRADLWRNYLKGLGITESYNLNEMKRAYWSQTTI